MKIIACKKVSKSYGEGTEKHQVLRDVSLQIQEGEFVTIMGPSGSGKSTLLYVLSGMEPLEKGKVFFNEKEIAKLNEKELAKLRRTEMGFVFQQPTMLKHLNILDNIVLPAENFNRKTMPSIINRAEKLMEQTDIIELKHRDITEVSGGQLQRAGICRALINKPKVLFGDEPTGALNSKTAEEIMELLLEINETGTTIMLVTHDPKVAAYSERVLFMQDGQIINELTLGRFNETNLQFRMEKISRNMYELGV